MRVKNDNLARDITMAARIAYSYWKIRSESGKYQHDNIITVWDLYSELS